MPTAWFEAFSFRAASALPHRRVNTSQGFALWRFSPNDSTPRPPRYPGCKKQPSGAATPSRYRSALHVGLSGRGSPTFPNRIDRARLAAVRSGTAMKAPRTLPLLVALTLLLGQQAGFAHALSHLDPGSQSKEGLAHTSLCAKCASFEQLSAMVPPCTAANLLRLATASQTRIGDCGCVRRTVSAFRSRAPPILR